MDYKKLLVEKDLKIAEAMKILDHIKPKILFVAQDNKLLGSLTDGDIRRYLLSKGSVADEVYSACNKQPKRLAHSLLEAVPLLDKNYIAIPVVDKEMKILDIYTGESFQKSKKKLNVPIVINAGGKGKRLEPFTKILPKPLIPVGELPIIEHIMRAYQDYGCQDFSIIVNYKKQLLKSYFNEIDREYPINWIDEKDPLGTGGGLYLLKNKIKDTFFFIGCDSLLLTDYNAILKYHKKNKNDITMICARKNLSVPYGIVEVDDNQTFLSMKEKPEYSLLTNTAMYVVEPKILKDLKKEKIDFPDIILRQKEKGRKIGVYEVSENDWLDMGVMSELDNMRKRLYGE